LSNLLAGISPIKAHRVSTNHSRDITGVGNNFKICPCHYIVQQKVFARLAVVDNRTIHLTALYQDALAVVQKNSPLQPTVTIKMATIKGEASVDSGSKQVVFRRMVKVKAVEATMAVIKPGQQRHTNPAINDIAANKLAVATTIPSPQAVIAVFVKTLYSEAAEACTSMALAHSVNPRSENWPRSPRGLR
jgi:hypothetical protein